MQISIIGHIAIYWKNLFYCQGMYASTTSSPSSYRTSLREGGGGGGTTTFWQASSVVFFRSFISPTRCGIPQSTYDAGGSLTTFPIQSRGWYGRTLFKVCQTIVILSPPAPLSMKTMPTSSALSGGWPPLPDSHHMWPRRFSQGIWRAPNFIKNDTILWITLSNTSGPAASSATMYSLFRTSAFTKTLSNVVEKGLYCDNPQY